MTEVYLTNHSGIIDINGNEKQIKDNTTKHFQTSFVNSETDSRSNVNSGSQGNTGYNDNEQKAGIEEEPSMSSVEKALPSTTGGDQTRGELTADPEYVKNYNNSVPSIIISDMPADAKSNSVTECDNEGVKLESDSSKNETTKEDILQSDVRLKTRSQSSSRVDVSNNDYVENEGMELQSSNSVSSSQKHVAIKDKDATLEVRLPKITHDDGSINKHPRRHTIAEMIKTLKEGKEELKKSSEARQNWKELKIFVKEQKIEIEKKRQLSAKSRASTSSQNEPMSSSRSLNSLQSKGEESTKNLDKDELLLFRYLLFVKMQEKQKQLNEQNVKSSEDLQGSEKSIKVEEIVPKDNENEPTHCDIESQSDSQQPDLAKSPKLSDRGSNENEDNEMEKPNTVKSKKLSDKDSPHNEDNEMKQPDTAESTKVPHQNYNNINVTKPDKPAVVWEADDNKKPNASTASLETIVETEETKSKLTDKKPEAKVQTLSDIIIDLKRERTNLVEKNNLSRYKDTRSGNSKATPPGTKNLSEEELEITDLFLIKYLKKLKAKKVSKQKECDNEKDGNKSKSDNSNLSRKEKIEHLRDLIVALKTAREKMAQNSTSVQKEKKNNNTTVQDLEEIKPEETTSTKTSDNPSNTNIQNADLPLLRYLALLKVQADKVKEKGKDDHPETARSNKPKSTPKKTPKRKKKLHAKVVMNQMIIDALTDANDRGERERLEQAILEYINADIQGKNELLLSAMEHLDLIRTRESLEDALEKKCVDRLKYTVEYSEKMEYESKLTPQLKRAQTFIQSEDIELPSLECVRGDTSELRLYRKPHKLVHSVIKATLLLLNEDEGKTKRWKKCQALLTPLGQKSLTRRTNGLIVDTLHSQIVARAKQLLSNTDHQEVSEASNCLQTLYRWSVNMISEYEFRHGAVEGVKPAKRRAQKRILRRIASEGNTKDEFKPLGLPMIDYVHNGKRPSILAASLPNTPRKQHKSNEPIGNSLLHAVAIYKGSEDDDLDETVDNKEKTIKTKKQKKDSDGKKKLKTKKTPRKESESETKSRFPKVQHKRLVEM